MRLKECFSSGYLKVVAVFIALNSSMPVAFAQYDIGKSGAKGGIQIIEQYIQGWLNFMSGPFAIAVVAGSIIIATCVFVFMPKGGWFGYFARALVGGIVLLNLGIFIKGL